MQFHHTVHTLKLCGAYAHIKEKDSVYDSEGSSNDLNLCYLVNLFLT